MVEIARHLGLHYSAVTQRVKREYLLEKRPTPMRKIISSLIVMSLISSPLVLLAGEDSSLSKVTNPEKKRLLECSMSESLCSLLNDNNLTEPHYFAERTDDKKVGTQEKPLWNQGGILNGIMAGGLVGLAIEYTQRDSRPPTFLGGSYALWGCMVLGGVVGDFYF